MSVVNNSYKLIFLQIETIQAHFLLLFIRDNYFRLFYLPMMCFWLGYYCTQPCVPIPSCHSCSSRLCQCCPFPRQSVCSSSPSFWPFSCPLCYGRLTLSTSTSCSFPNSTSIWKYGKKKRLTYLLLDSIFSPLSIKSKHIVHSTKC